jgi:galactonate dehydratase
VREKRAAAILPPDLSHAGGIMEARLIAGMAGAYSAGIAPHCPLRPIALAACLQPDAAIPNSLAQEGGRITGEGYLKTPFRHEHGFLPLPTGPGLGMELDEGALADMIDHDWQNPRAYSADDGSAIDRQGAGAVERGSVERRMPLAHRSTLPRSNGVTAGADRHSAA